MTRAQREARLDRIFGALSDRTRRSILARLRVEPANIGELATPYDMSLPAVSKHVRVLERAGLVRRSVDGRVHRCQLDAKALQSADRWLSDYRAFWEGTLDGLASYLGDSD